MPVVMMDRRTQTDRQTYTLLLDREVRVKRWVVKRGVQDQLVVSRHLDHRKNKRLVAKRGKDER